MTTDLEALTGIHPPTGMLVGGQWRAGSAGVIPVIDPATEEPIAEVASASPQDALEAVAAAAAAQPKWAATPPRERGECLRRAYQLMTDRVDALARLMVMENGKALRDARGEVSYAAEFFRWYAEEAVRNEGSLMTAPSGANRIMVTRQPVGVSVVLKPAKETPLSALAIAWLLSEAGVPDGVVNVVPTATAGPVVSAMLGDPRVRKLSFTGSTEVGRVLLRTAAQTVTKCSMELGGNAPFIVFGDADIDAAVDGAYIAKMRNGGEACTAANRFYVHEAVADDFTEALSERLGGLVTGPGLDSRTDLGPLVNEDTRSKVAKLVAGAVNEGAQVLTGGSAPDRRGYFYLPTVIDQVPQDAGIQ